MYSECIMGEQTDINYQPYLSVAMEKNHVSMRNYHRGNTIFQEKFLSGNIEYHMREFYCFMDI